MDDARIAVETGVDGVDVVIGTSAHLREHSHGKDMTYIKNTAIEVIQFVKSKGIEIRFSSEDSFRSDLVDLLTLYSAVDKIGVNRVGIADTVGCATSSQVYDLVRTLRGVVSCEYVNPDYNMKSVSDSFFTALKHISTTTLVAPFPTHTRLSVPVLPTLTHPCSESASATVSRLSVVSWHA